MSEVKDIKALRKQCVDYMREMSNIKWTPQED